MIRNFNLIPTLAIMAALVAGHAAPAAAATGAEIKEMCAPYPDGDNVTCAGYVSALAEIVDHDDPSTNPKGKLCVGDTPVADLVAQTNRWLAAHPELLSQSAYDAVYGGLAAKFACK